MCRSYNSIITAHEAHVETDECGAPEFFSHGSKILLARSPLGKLDPADVERIVMSRNDLHFPKPRALSISQSTELGTVYRPGEIKGLGTLAKQHGLGIHMDGARFFNALASQHCSPADITWRAGVDVLCCGGTKLGMAVTEAVVFFNKELSQDFQYRCKQAGQLCSKMRFISAQWLRMLKGETWKKHASSANSLARRLSDALGNLPGVQILYPVDANAVFAKLPDKMKAGLKERGWVFYSFIGGGTRLMCSWRTTEADVEAFVKDAEELAS
jgi:threonine aldolase